MKDYKDTARAKATAFEDTVTKELKLLFNSKNHFFTKFADSRGWGGKSTPATPADYSLILNTSSIHYYIEFKWVEDSVGFSLASMLKPSQWKRLVDSIRYNFNYYLLIYSLELNKYYFLSSQLFRESNEKKKYTFKFEQFEEFSVETLPELITKYFT